MIKNYKEYIFEKLIVSIVNESKIHYSDTFLNILLSMKDDKVASELIKLKTNNIDTDFKQNLIDISNRKDLLSFVTDTKFDQMSGDDVYTVAPGIHTKYLTLNKKDGKYVNQFIFDQLGFKPKSDKSEFPSIGTTGSIISEFFSKKSGNTYVLFKTGNHEYAINKSALTSYNNQSYTKLWSTNRNNVKIGKLVQSLLNAAHIEVSQPEIESFVNKYKASFSVLNDVFSRFDRITGDDISKWYQFSSYEGGGKASLGSSCMSNAYEALFDIYTHNKNVCSLLILYCDKGEIVNDKYTSNKIVGRALVWKTEQGDTVMDRIYTNEDSDIETFRRYAIDKGWWYKKTNDSSNVTPFTNGTIDKSAQYTIQLDKSKFNFYPYLDTFSYLNSSLDMLSNVNIIDADYRLTSTEGEMFEL